jgi:hypothetical protein
LLKPRQQERASFMEGQNSEVRTFRNLHALTLGAGDSWEEWQTDMVVQYDKNNAVPGICFSFEKIRRWD